ncbi:FecCD family ABC transporter permease [Bacillus sp. RAR_GA_16]|uniref:FecCD family ABC transporter permease n=1 Tax=Bacillus sp. RAR_GA_16 TaxID=2876774 RepID=UPI001CCD3CC6|nr:iron ABC transporter permease [Bacillus sp. RAR_GA_16]MCA0173887.1 iron ABC transporter permease [Bacillus sp. RAR_GA_16]
MSKNAEQMASTIENQLAVQSRPVMAMVILVVGSVGLILTLGLSIALGAADIQLMTVWKAIFQFDTTSTEHSIIREFRMPRSVADILIGASFAVAGAIMQGVTRNPLADSGLLGLNAGATLMIALCFAFFPGLSYTNLMLFSFVGAGIGAVLVFGIGSLSRNGPSPIRLVLAGAAVSALFTAVSEGIAIHFQLSQNLAFWFAGGTAGLKWPQIQLLLPWVIIALIVALLLSKSISLLSLGEDVAVGLGQRTGLIKVLAAVVVLVLAGAAVSAVGPIGFVGLVIPHIARFLVGVDYRWIVPCSAVLGGLFMIVADMGARLINAPYETPIGAIFALVGVPFFLYVARREGREL